MKNNIDKILKQVNQGKFKGYTLVDELYGAQLYQFIISFKILEEEANQIKARTEFALMIHVGNGNKFATLEEIKTFMFAKAQEKVTEYFKNLEQQINVFRATLN